MAVQTRFCGRCGAPVALGATFCGRCGTPVVAAVAAAYPAYSYPRIQAPAARIGGARSTQIAVAIGLVAILIVVAAVAGALALRGVTANHSNCTANCAPKIVRPLPASATFHSSQFKFEVDYSSNWTVRNQTAAGIDIGTQAGSVSVMGTSSTAPLDQAIQAVVSGLPSASWQNVAAISDIKGAHLGEQNGLGALYSANLVGSGTTAVKVRLSVIAATKAGVTVVVFAVNRADTQHFASGMPEGQLFDYMCTEFRWA